MTIAAKVVISLGGSLIAPDGVDVSFLKKFREMILGRPERFVIICGGGKTARRYQDAAQSLIGSDDDALDWIGISATHLNANLLRLAFEKDAEQEIVVDPTKKVSWTRKLLVAGGWKPGRSTDYDAVILARKYGIGMIINMSNVDYVYEQDPRKKSDAKRMPFLSWQGFFKIVGDKWKPGMSAPFDPIAAQEAEKSGLKVIIVGQDLGNLAALLDGSEFNGTLIS